MKPTDIVDKQTLRTDIPKVGPGDEVKVHVRVVESGKERVQIFQGNVISVYGSARQLQNSKWSSVAMYVVRNSTTCASELVSRPKFANFAKTNKFRCFSASRFSRHPH
jgi:ribosomal protein L19